MVLFRAGAARFAAARTSPTGPDDSVPAYLIVAERTSVSGRPNGQMRLRRWGSFFLISSSA